jgi:hypothetical protein
MRGTVRIVFNPLNATVNAVFITFEIYHTVVLFMAATTMTCGDTTGVISPTSA